MTDKTIKPPELLSEVAPRHLDPFEVAYQGIIRTGDPILRDHANGDVSLYRDLARDDGITRALVKRQAALLGREWYIEPLDKNAAGGTAAAERITEALRSFAFDAGCRSLLDALLLGWSPVEVVWHLADDGMIMPQRMIARAHRRFIYLDPPEGGGEPELRLKTSASMLTGQPLPPRCIIAHRYRAEDGNPYGLGLGYELYWPVYFKRRNLVAWARRNDRFGSPTPWGKYPVGATPAEKHTLAQALQAFSTESYIMTPEGMQLSLLEAASTGALSEEAFAGLLDDQIDGIIVGQDSHRKASGAPGAAAQERAAVRLDIVSSDGDELGATLTDTLLRWICEINALPRCAIYWRVEPPIDTQKQAAVDEIVSRLGYRPTPQRIAELYGEGWEPYTAAPPAPSPLSAFAEAPDRSADPVEQIVLAAESQGADAQRALVQQIGRMVATAPSLPALRDQLLHAYAELDQGELRSIMRFAFAAAELHGRAAAAEEGGA